MQDIVVGRSKADLEKFGLKGAIFIGRHYITMGNTQSLSNNVYMDVAGAHVVFICGKRGGGKCLTGNTLIELHDGSQIKIKDLEKNDAGVMSLNSDLKMTSVEKSDFYKRTTDKILRVRLRSGKELELTPEHPLLCVAGWKKAQDFSIGDRLATPRIIPNFGDKDLKEYIVKILAYLIAEGHLSNGFILFTNSDEILMDEFKKSINQFDTKLELNTHSEYTYRIVNKKEYRYDVKAQRNTDGTYKKGVKVTAKSSLRLYLESLDLYGCKATHRTIPNCIFTLPKHKLSLFLNRLFSCDGTIYFDTNKQSWIISYSSASKDLVLQLQSLLQKYAVLSRIRSKLNNGLKSFELNILSQSVHLFLQEIGFFGKKEIRQAKCLRETKTPNPNVDTIPKEIWEHYRPENWAEVGRAIGYKNQKSLRSSVNYAPSRQKLLSIATIDNNEYIQRLANADIFWDEVISISEHRGSFEVYDITVPEVHNFVANGVIVHNSYTMGAMAEGFHLLEPEIKENLSVILLDTMGIYWTMKYPNHQDKILLEQWGLKPQSIPIKIFTPEKYYHIYKKQGIPTDVPFTLAPSAIDPDDWCNAFKLDKYSPSGILINNAVTSLRENPNKPNYLIENIVAAIDQDQESDKDTKDKVSSMFKMAEGWGVFSDHGTPLSELAKGGQITVLDVSCYATMPGGWDVKALMVGLVGQRLFVDRMVARKGEEYDQVSSAVNFFSKDAKKKQDMPLVWLVIDEAHEFLPREGSTAASESLITIMREGRQPGISLVLATQQPGKIHTDVMTQSDTVLSHRITAKIDVDALGMLMQSYMRQGLVGELDKLPRVKGAGILFDDQNEKMYPIRIRPRFTWHGGSSPTAIPKENKDEDDFI